MERCRTLSDYMKFVDKVRSRQTTLGTEAAVRQAVEECIAEGILRNRLELICRKLKKGKSAEQIAEELEESTDNLRPIIDTAERFAPEYDIDSILKELSLNNI